MNKLEFLQQGKLLEDRIKYTDIRINQYRQQLESLHSTPFDREYTTGTRNLDSIQAQMIPMIMELETQSLKEKYKLLQFKKQFYQATKKLDGKDRLILEMAFIQDKSWTCIAETLCCHRTTAKDWVLKAVEMIDMPKDPVVLD